MSSRFKDENFKDLLNQEYNWPSPYLFKFIVPKNQKNHISKLFPHHQLEFRASKKGNYVSLTVTVECDSADLVLAIYEKAALIDGLIAL